MPLAPPFASVQGSPPASRQRQPKIDQLSARTLLPCVGFRGRAAPVEHPPAVGLLSAHTPQRAPSVAAVSFIGGSGDHDVGELSPQVAIDRVMVESAAGDEHRQQIRFRCDTGRSGRCSRAGTDRPASPLDGLSDVELRASRRFLRVASARSTRSRWPQACLRSSCLARWRRWN